MEWDSWEFGAIHTDLYVWSYIQQQGSSAAAGMEVERLKLEYRRSMQTVQQWQKMYENLHQFCLDELLDGDQAGG